MLKTTIIKQLKNTAWIVRFTDDNGKSYVRFVANAIVSGLWGVKKIWVDEYVYVETPKATVIEMTAEMIEEKAAQTKLAEWKKNNAGFQAWNRSVNY